MGKADTLCFRGQTLATWKQSRPSQRLDLDALQAAHPALVAGFKRTVPGSRRFLLKAHATVNNSALSSPPSETNCSVGDGVEHTSLRPAEKASERLSTLTPKTALA